MKKPRKKSGYLQKFRHNIDLNTFGVGTELIEWCKRHSVGSWGWWFWTHSNWDNLAIDIYDEQAYKYNRAYMSFQYKRDALRFWFWLMRNADSNT
jgi:accessory colonization factor AcfC